MTNFLKGLEEATTVGRTENGAKTYTSTLSANVDFFANAGAKRGREDDIRGMFLAALDEDPETALRNLVHLRNIRMGGLGERTSFRKAFEVLVDTRPESAIKLVQYVAEIGRWDDTVEIFEYADSHNKPEVANKAFDLIAGQLLEDVKSMDKGGDMSLLAKWIPSTSVKSPRRKAIAYKIASKLGYEKDHKSYRKLLSTMRTELDIVEKKLAAKDYASIEFEKLPSKAIFKYREAFERNASDRYSAFLDAVEKGEASINASTLLPYEIIRAYSSGGWGSPDTKDLDQSLELSWKALEDVFEGIEDNALVVADTSASMVPDPWFVAESLAIMCGEKLQGPLKNHFMTFSTSPKLIKLPEHGTLRDKMLAYRKHSIVSSTDIAAVYDLLLQTAVNHNLTQEQLPSKLLIISDMEFNQGARNCSMTNFEQAKQNFREKGYELPSIVFWNVDSRNNNSEVRFNEQGVALVSGLTPQIFKQVLGKSFNSPVELMLEVLYKPEYDFVKVCVG